MYVEFDEQLINSIYFGKVEKVDVVEGSTTTYSLSYELINGAKYIKGYASESDRDGAYNALKTDGGGGGGSGSIITYDSTSQSIVATAIQE